MRQLPYLYALLVEAGPLPRDGADLRANVAINSSRALLEPSPEGLTDLGDGIKDTPSETGGPSRITGEDADVAQRFFFLARFGSLPLLSK